MKKINILLVVIAVLLALSLLISAIGVAIPDGRVARASVLASDAAHYYGNIHRRSPFPIVYNIGDMFEGWAIVERLAGHVDRVIPGHDPLVREIYPRASEACDAYALHLEPTRSFG